MQYVSGRRVRVIDTEGELTSLDERALDRKQERRRGGHQEQSESEEVILRVEPSIGGNQ